MSFFISSFRRTLLAKFKEIIPSEVKLDDDVLNVSHKSDSVNEALEMYSSDSLMEFHLGISKSSFMS